MQYSELITIFAATYNCGAYSAGTYNGAESCTTAPATGNEGGLPNTGLDVYLPLGTGVLLVIAAIVLLMALLRKRNKKPRSN